MPPYPNGRWPQSALLEIPGAPGQFLKQDAALSKGRIIAAARAAGVSLPKYGVLTDSYRPYSVQEMLRKRWCARGRCHMAAWPGTSKHGNAEATDDYPALWQWEHKNLGFLADNGWFWPAWARPGQRSYEPWHHEYAESRDKFRGKTGILVPVSQALTIGDDDMITADMKGNHVKDFQELCNNFLIATGSSGPVLTEDGHWGVKGQKVMRDHVIPRLRDKKFTLLEGLTLAKHADAKAVSSSIQALMAAVISERR